MNYKKWVFVAIALFGVGLVLGLVTPASFADPLFREIIASLEELGGGLAQSSIFTFVFIFVKNAVAVLVGFILSPVLCLAPILSLTINGWILSYVVSAVAQEKSIGFVLAGLLPHGILEIPALIIAQAAALSFGVMAILALVKKEKRGLLVPNLKRNFRYILIALSLLLPAAAIETYVTPLLLNGQ